MPHLLKFIVTACWVVLICLGFSYAWQYETTAGTAAKAPVDWPAGSGLQLDRTKPTIIMFAHPECPCTKVSIGNLAQMLSDYPGRLAVYVVVVEPKGLTAPVEQSPAWRLSKRMAEARVIVDPNGAEAQRFGAKTSGQVLVYLATGNQVFSGGVTVARGHEGKSGGQSAIAAILENSMPVTRTTPVYGCSLLGSEGGAP